ncbi:hypothetical protein PSACC_01281 [Paramicrosporidium saccamoebae]|uniref:Cation-transporting P-type ATPase N-terminal domain-containing protein n=1 Tax=Paramicrosporidium saccamoebae TaxID=1246581 RepID=A0A2H9TMJ1_9FUNG|nr:hypothetical protein PSACC_01281 [Paramicrosporidium saccamoebae]
MGDESVWDGKISIEHQIDIHVRDLLQCSPAEHHEILTGLQYVMEYRVRGRQQRTLDPTICDKLVRALLISTGTLTKGGIFVERKLTTDADFAFVLLVDYCQEVEECAQSLVGIRPEELRLRLRLGKRLAQSSEQNVKMATMALLRSLSPECDWREYFAESEVETVRTILEGHNFFTDGNLKEKRRTTTVTLHPPPALYFDRSAKRVLDMFHTSIEQGLSTEDVLLIRPDYGKNEIPLFIEKPIWKMFLSQLTDVMIVILTITAIVSAAVDFPNIESAVVLGVVVVLNVIIGFWQELKSSRTISAMKSLEIPKARVCRDGQDEEICATELVPGDIVILAEGDYVPADLRLVQCSRLEIKETILTGENDGVSKSIRPIREPTRRLQLVRCEGNAFMGTMVTRGTAIGVVVRTGAATEIGRIGAALNENTETKPSPLQRKMGILGKCLVLAAVVLCALVFTIGLIQGIDIPSMTRLAISLAVSVIPEGLVAILTVGMALSVRRLTRRGVLVRQMNAIETLGCTSVVAADKTGTLTEGKMRLEELWILGEDTTLAMNTCILCNNASLQGHGEPTEVALLEGVSSRGSQTEEVQARWKRLIEIPFDSERRMMSVLVTEGDKSDELTLYCKGAAESVLEKCQKILVNGEVQRLDRVHLAVIEEKEDSFSDRGLRVLALAMKSTVDLSGFPDAFDADSEDLSLFSFMENEMVFVGLVGLYDPPREDVAESVAQCQRAGIKVCMITGDHLKTATAIATQLGIYNQGRPELSRVLNGHDLDLLSVEVIAALRPFPSVFARVSPSNKLSIVQALQRRNETVVMTGDGVNDAPAIRQANVGVAMGRGGTQITRDAAAVILLNDDFTSILHAIAEGRQMYRNVTLFIVYLLSCNSAEIWTVLGAMIAGWDAPFSPMNILWANVIADIPPSLCLGLERDPIEDLMTDVPKVIAPRVVGSATWLLIAINGATLSALTLAMYGTLPPEMSLIERRSEAFVVLIGLQLIMALISRSIRKSLFRAGILGNLHLLAAVIFSFALLIAGLYIPFLADLLDLRPVSGNCWIKFGVAVVVMVIVNEFFKMLIRRARL